MSEHSGDWGAENTETFLDYGRLFVPEREQQVAIVAALVPPCDTPCRALDLACGEGLLSAALLERLPTATVYGYDGSAEMLRAAAERLAAYGERFQTVQFDLKAHDWRQLPQPAHAVVSSLSIHHLDDDEKQALFRDVYAMLAPGGVFVIADVVQPADDRGVALAAAEWDEAVRRRARALGVSEADALAIFERERWNMYRYPDADPVPYDKPSRLHDQLNWLAAAGFSGVDVYWMLAGHAIYGGRRAE